MTDQNGITTAVSAPRAEGEITETNNNSNTTANFTESPKPDIPLVPPGFGIPRALIQITSAVQLQRKSSVHPEVEYSQLEISQPLYRVTPKRWIILLIFACYSMSNSFQWIQYAIIEEKITFFYGVTPDEVDWLSKIYMVIYIPLVFPAMWLLDLKGLRLVALIGSFGNFLGAAIKCFSTYPDRFPITFLGQTISALSQIFILAIPARLAAVWFPAAEIAVATAVGVFGNQLGVALSFVLPPYLVPTVENSTMTFENGTVATVSSARDTYGQSLAIMFYGSAAINGFLFVVVLIVFKDAPKYPPSSAHAAVLAEALKTTYAGWILVLMKNRNFVVLLVSYGLIVGAGYAISILLNPCILKYFPDADQDAGLIGMTIVLSSLPGSFAGGLWLSWSGNYKSTTLLMYILSLLSMVIFTAILSSQTLWVVYFSAALLGFFQTGYLPVALQFAAELTYPAPESTSSGLLTCSAEIFGFIMTYVMRIMLGRYEPITANGVVNVGCLFIGTVMTCFIKSDLRRTAASKELTDDKKAVVPLFTVPPSASK